jgi:phosphoglycolate phosphatase
MRYALVLFDFDGTLADSLGPALAIYHRIAPGLGLKPITDVDAARSMPTRQLLRHLGVRFWRLPRLVRAFQAAAAEHAHELQLFPAVPDMLRSLHAAGHRLGVLSSNREDTIRTALRTAGVEDLFAFVVGYPKLFGKAKALRRILKQEHLDRSDVLFVGDELRDVEAGRKARVATAAVTWGFHHESLLAGGGATHLVRSPADLPGVAAARPPDVPGFRVRKFRRADTEPVIALWHRAGLTRPWNDPHKDVRRKLRVQRDLFLVGVLDGKVVAAAMAGYDGHRGTVYYLGVDPGHRRKGYGRALMAEAERRLAKLGCPKVNLLVRTANHEVIEFYRKLGYAVDEVVSLGKRLEPDAPPGEAADGHGD